MLKKKFQIILLLEMLFSSCIFAAIEPSLASDLMDITERLNEYELKLIEQHNKVVYLTPELVEALNCVETNQNSALKDLKETIHFGDVVAPYGETLEAVNHAITLCEQQDPKHQSLNALYSYKSMLENDEATLIVEQVPSRKNCKTKKFNRVCASSVVAQCLRANSATLCTASITNVLNVHNINGITCSIIPGSRPLLINGDVRICGELSGSTGSFENINTVNETINGVLNVNNINGTTCSVAPGSRPLLINSDVNVCGSFNSSTGSFQNINTVNETITGVLNVCNINGTTCAGAPTGCPLLINSDVTICGTINGSIFPPPPLAECISTTPTTFVPSLDSCGNVTFNTLTNTLNAAGAFEANLQILRGVIGFNGTAIAAGDINVPAIGSGAVTIAGGFPTATIISPLINSGLDIPGAIGLIPALSTNADVLGIAALTNSLNTGLNTLVGNVNTGLGSVISGVNNGLAVLVTDINAGLGGLIANINGSVATLVTNVNTGLGTLITDANNVFANVVGVSNSNFNIINVNVAAVQNLIAQIGAPTTIPTITIPDIPDIPNVIIPHVTIPAVVIPGITIPGSLSLSTSLGFTFHVDFDSTAPFVDQPTVELTYALSNPASLVSSADLGVQSLAITAGAVSTTGMDINIILNVASSLNNIGTTLTAPLAALLNNIFASGNLQINLIAVGKTA